MIVLWAVFSRAFSSSLCPAFTCELPTDYIEENTCVFYKQSLAVPTYYASKCFDINRNFCPPTFGKNSSCTDPPIVITLKYPGEKCQTDADCGEFTKGCKFQVCQGLSQGQSCKSHSYCNPGLRCSETCVPLIQSGSSGCLSDNDCENNSGCDISPSTPSGTCISYFSLSDYSSVQSCLNNSNLLCTSATCSGNQCVPPSKSLNIPQACLEDSDCDSSDSSVVGSCVCGKNRNGNKYCNLLPGDKWFESYFNLSKQWQRSGFVHKCNTVRRFSFVCAGDWWDRRASYLMNYYYFYSTQFPSVIEYDDCIGQIYLKEFLQVKELLKNILDVEDLALVVFPWLFLLIN